MGAVLGVGLESPVVLGIPGGVGVERGERVVELVAQAVKIQIFRIESSPALSWAL